jgi:hypothetical protein
MSANLEDEHGPQTPPGEGLPHVLATAAAKPSEESPPNESGAPASQQSPDDGGVAARIAGLSTLKGLVVYGATLTFAGFYAYFMEQIASSPSGTPPTLSTPMVSAAGVLAGILGSAFALVIGVPTSSTNQGLAAKLEAGERVRGLWLWRLLSLEPGGASRASLPLTFGIWMYAAVAAAVAIIYFLNPGETPGPVKALATVFAGYVVAFMTAAYGISTQTRSGDARSNPGR